MKGDHLRVKFGVYYHHGLDVGDGTVIHFGRGLADIENARVEKVARELFSKDRPIEVVSAAAEFSADEIVRRAESCLGQSGYNLFDNNCEHFVNWCRTGQASSSQIDKGETLTRQFVAASAKPILSGILRKRALSTVAGKAIARGGFAGVIGDLAQTGVEFAASSRGADKASSRKAGRQAGAAASTVAGFVVGGPVGGATGLAFWASGQFIAGRIVGSARDVVDGTIHPAS
ncbi:MAG: lecithin retinol acyltransferase family protein [Planctomycetota bacterium]